jgi:peptidoglycan/LPS O-acetylase OafA/YrhL
MYEVQRGTPRPYRKAFGIAGILLVIISALYAVLLVRSGRPAYDAGYVLGRLFGGPLLVGAAISGFWASRARKPWSRLRIGIVLVLFAIAVLVVSILGQVTGH